jgi:sugar (pentulose or hexulose) kinase
MDCPDAHAFWIGEPSDDAERYRAVLEGVAFVERLSYEHLGRLGATAEGPVAAAGAASRSRVWTSIRASVLGRPMAVATDATTAFGACLLAAAGTVHQDLVSATGAMTSPGDEIEPDQDEALEENFRRLLAALRERGWIDA